MKTSLGTFRGVNNPRPSDIMSSNRAANWRDFTWFLASCSIVTFGWIGKDVVRIIWEAMF